MSVAAATAMRARIIMFFMLIAREIEIVRRKVRFSASDRKCGKDASEIPNFRR